MGSEKVYVRSNANTKQNTNSNGSTKKREKWDRRVPRTVSDPNFLEKKMGKQRINRLPSFNDYLRASKAGFSREEKISKRRLPSFTNLPQIRKSYEPGKLRLS